MKDFTAAIITLNDKVLLTRRAPGEKHAGWWEFPGGEVEEDESPESCLHRELLEELGIEAEIGEKLTESIYTYETAAIRLLAYCVTIISGNLFLHVHNEYQWVSLHELRQFQLLPTDVAIAELLEKESSSIPTSGGSLY